MKEYPVPSIQMRLVKITRRLAAEQKLVKRSVGSPLPSLTSSKNGAN